MTFHAIKYDIIIMLYTFGRSPFSLRWYFTALYVVKDASMVGFICSLLYELHVSYIECHLILVA